MKRGMCKPQTNSFLTVELRLCLPNCQLSLTRTQVLTPWILIYADDNVDWKQKHWSYNKRLLFMYSFISLFKAEGGWRKKKSLKG